MKKLIFSIALAASIPAFADTIGEVDVAFKLLGPDHKIVVETFDDPGVQGVTCVLSRSKAGGISGALGFAEEKTEASIACRQVGPIAFNGALPKQEDVFSQKMSILFKRLHVIRMVEPKRNMLVYLTYSDKLIDGSPKNSVTAVPVDVKIPLK